LNQWYYQPFPDPLERDLATIYSSVRRGPTESQPFSRFFDTQCQQVFLFAFIHSALLKSFCWKNKTMSKHFLLDYFMLLYYA
jgi:hypothetical protein